MTCTSYDLKHTIKSHKNDIGKVIWSPDGKYLTTGCADGYVRLFNSTNYKLEVAIEGHIKGINDINWSKESDYICTCSDDGKCKIWDIKKVISLDKFSANRRCK